MVGDSFSIKEFINEPVDSVFLSGYSLVFLFFTFSPWCLRLFFTQIWVKFTAQHILDVLTLLWWRMGNIQLLTTLTVIVLCVENDLNVLFLTLDEIDFFFLRDGVGRCLAWSLCTKHIDWHYCCYITNQSHVCNFRCNCIAHLHPSIFINK